jgi:hypothetical protein
MPLLSEDIAFGLLLPALLAGSVAFLAQGAKPQGLRSRYGAALGLALAFSAAYHFLSWAPWQPTSTWHWLPYLAGLAAVLAPVGLASGVSFAERWALHLLLALLAAWFLVPTWEAIAPDRAYYLLFLAGMLFLASISLEPLATFIPRGSFPSALALVGVGGAFVLVQSGNMKFAQLAGALAAALAGSATVAWWQRDTTWFRGSVPVAVVLLGGLLFTGYVHSFSDIPFLAYLLVLLAPLGLWVGALPSRPGWNQRLYFLLGLTLVLVPFGVALVLAWVYAEPPW